MLPPYVVVKPGVFLMCRFSKFLQNHQKNYISLKKWLNERKTNEDIKKNKINYRLPTHLKPFYYEISIKSFIGSMFAEKSFKFDGNINISFTCLNSTDKIVLHIKDLEIKNETLKLTHSNDKFSAI